MFTSDWYTSLIMFYAPSSRMNHLVISTYTYEFEKGGMELQVCSSTIPHPKLFMTGELQTCSWGGWGEREEGHSVSTHHRINRETDSNTKHKNLYKHFSGLRVYIWTSFLYVYKSMCDSVVWRQSLTRGRCTLHSNTSFIL